jgi:hypothetical protein
LVLLVVAVFSLATLIDPRAATWKSGDASASVLKLVLGDSRRMFANHFFVQADVSFHSGYYPTIFDQAQAPKGSRHMTAQEGSKEDEEHERQMQFLGPPTDWIERLGRHFMITQHSHLAGSDEREILPWLRISAELDPQRIDTYTVASYFLRGGGLNKPEEAEKFLREGLRNNPNSYELLLELGRLYQENYHDATKARGVWELALRRWNTTEAKKKEPDLNSMEEITMRLARLEEDAGHLEQAVTYLEMACKASPQPQAIQKQIEALKAKIAAKAGSS